MKKIISALLSLTLTVLFLAGCAAPTPKASEAPASAPPVSQAPASQAPASQAPASQAPAEQVTITLMRTGTPEVLRGIFEPIIAEFEKEYPNIKIDMQDLGWADAEKTLQTMASSKTLPDIMYHLPGTIFDMADKGLVLDLTPYLDQEIKDDMYPAMLSAGQYDGKQYMIACGASTIMLWYNAELFKQAGLDPDKPPKNWTEFKEACEKLSKINGITPLGLYAKSAGGETSFLYESLFTAEFGGGAWDGATNRYIYDSDAGKQAAINTLQFMQDITKYAQDSYVEYGRFDTRTLLRDGKVAMVLDAINMANQIKDQLNDGSMRCTVIPAGASGVNSSAVNVGGWYIPTNSKHPNEAWTFLRYLMKTENQIKHATYGSVPILKSEAKTYTSGYMAEVVKSVENSYSEGISPKTNALWAVNGEQLQLLMMGKQTAEETQKNMAEGHGEVYE